MVLLLGEERERRDVKRGGRREGEKAGSRD
jgi:hypothetical protein